MSGQKYAQQIACLSKKCAWNVLEAYIACSNLCSRQECSSHTDSINILKKLSCAAHLVFTPITIQQDLRRILFPLDTFLKAILDLTQSTIKSSLVSILQYNIVALVYRNLRNTCTHQTSSHHCNSSEQNDLYQSLKFAFCKMKCWQGMVFKHQLQLTKKSYHHSPKFNIFFNKVHKNTMET